jgi:hypothetical protein
MSHTVGCDLSEYQNDDDFWMHYSLASLRREVELAIKESRTTYAYVASVVGLTQEEAEDLALCSPRLNVALLSKIANTLAGQ